MYSFKLNSKLYVVSTLIMKCYKMLTLPNLGRKNLTMLYDTVLSELYDFFFKNELVETKAQNLKVLIMSKKLKEDTPLLGIQKPTNNTKVKCNVFEI